ncbi:hypothetical protein [Chryseobacterium limigenitum]|uniref:hypothetical protein n=1 Tax=Chryseobacterium limigenitum TaxID=1612149 RepID=UPI001480EC23|nr:hypothetical protein [Chryseobacterium limigenitum]
MKDYFNLILNQTAENNIKRFLVLIVFFGLWSLFQAQEKTIIKILSRKLKKK